jgi:hypothetical protein
MSEVNRNKTRVDVGIGLFLTRREIRKRFDALLCHLITLAQVGDTHSQNRIKQIHKLLNGDFYVVVPTGVERAIRFYQQMFALALVVQPADEECNRVLDRPVLLSEAGKREYPDIYEWAKKHWKPRSNLRSLTIRAFLEIEGKVYDVHTRRAIQHNLKALEKWEANRPAELRSTIKLPSGEEIPHYFELRDDTTRAIRPEKNT